MKYLLILALINPLAYADRAVDITKGTAAEFDGVLMDKEKANKIKNELIEKASQSQLIQSYERSIKLFKSNDDLMAEKSDLLYKQNIELSKELNRSRGLNTIEKIGLIVLGAAITVGAGHALQKAGR